MTEKFFLNNKKHETTRKISWKAALMDTRHLDLSLVDKMDWSAIRSFGERTCPSACSVRIPLQFPESDRLILCDPALNVSVLPVPPDIRTHDPETPGKLKQVRSLISCFALEDPPFLPDFHCTKMQRDPAGLPIITMRIFCYDLLYQFTYAADPDGFIHIAVRIENQYWEPRIASIRWKVFFGHERDFFDYHYVPFNWTARRWKTDPSLSYQPENGLLCCQEATFGRVEAGSFQVSWQGEAQFVDDDYNHLFNCQAPHFAQPEMQLRQSSHLLLLQKNLAPGESQTFHLTMNSNFSAQNIIPPKGSEENFRRIRRQWLALQKKQLPASIDFGDAQENQALRSLHLCNLQYLLKLNSPTMGSILQPCQGSSSERFYVWVWEAMCMMRVHLQLGNFTPVRKVLEYIFKLQDGGCPPVGEFTHLDGAIGTTGPRWANATGSALLLAAEFLLFANDPDFQLEFLPKMLRAARWIISQRQSTDRPEVPELQRGLFPKACATDGDEGWIYAFTDLYSCAGLVKFSCLLRQLRHPQSPEIAEASLQYCHKLCQTMRKLQQKNGFVPRKLCNDGRLAPKFGTTTTVIAATGTGILPAGEAILRKYVKYCENHLVRYPFFAMMDYAVAYIGNNELAFQKFYLQQGKWAQAWLAFRSFFLYGMSGDLFLTQERFSTMNPAFAPWQPNSSNNGRLMEALLNRAYLECQSSGLRRQIILLGGFAPFELENRPAIKLTNLHTSYGRMSLLFEKHTLKLNFERQLPKHLEFRLPQNFQPAEKGQFSSPKPGVWKLKVATSPEAPLVFLAVP